MISQMASLYNQGETVDITRSPSDALLVIDSADRSSSTSSTGVPLSAPYTQPYNNFRLQKPQNMLQGGFTRLQLTEVNFPYAIPNVNDYTNSFWIQIVNPASPPNLITQQVTIPNNFYSGRDLAATLGTTDASGVVIGVLNNGTYPAISTTPGYTWTVGYLPESETYVSQAGGFKIFCNLTSSPHTAIRFSIFPCDPSLIGKQPIPSKSMLSLMGFDPLTNWNYCTSLSLVKTSVYASLSYTSYIDIVSNKLTYYQKVSDASSKVNSSGNIICRLYVSNETSDAGSQGFYVNSASAFNPVVYQSMLPVGSVPFLIHRQYHSPKSIRWNMNQAIDWIDIKLLDDGGNPLYISPDFAYPNFQITFKATED